MPFFRFVSSLVSVAWAAQLLEEALAITFLCRGLPRERKQGLLFLRDLAGMYAALFITCFLVLYIVPDVFIVVRYLTFLMLVSAYMHVCSASSTNAKWIMAFSMASGAMCISSISSQASTLLLAWGSGAGAAGVVSSALFALLLPLSLFLRRFVLDDYENAIPGGGVLLILVGALSIFCLLCFEQTQQNLETEPVVFLFIIAFTGLLAMTMAGVFAIYVMCISRRERLLLQNETERLRSEKEMSAMTAAALEDLRCIRHELRNQYAYIRLLMSEKRYGELESYCSRLTDNIPTQMQTVDCGNAFLNVLLSMWISKARLRGIEVETGLVVPPELPFPEDDLCALLSNLLENAVEACEKSGDTRIRINIEPRRDYLSIVCSNPTDMTGLHRFAGGLLTTKSDQSLHGYGTRIIARIAARCNGIVDYSVEDGWFYARVLLDMNGKGADA